MSEVDDTLLNWDSIRNDFDRPGILIGNGASIAVWDQFSYDSIYNIAKNLEPGSRLTDQAISIFETINTTNFEKILAFLKISENINTILGIPIDLVVTSYENIKSALVSAVHQVHLPWENISEEILKKINEALRDYDSVFSTNYDLLIYWSIMNNNARGFKDYFWNERFDQFNIEIWDRPTKIMYMHGGLHLYRDLDGFTYKRRAANYLNLLDLFGSPYINNAVPLIITEGTSADKLSSIKRSDYLSFCYSEFRKFNGPLVIFGHALGESDEHITKIISEWGERTLAFSIRSGNSDAIKRKKGYLISKFPAAHHVFFNALTHPLGSLDLHCAQFVEE
jgi:hypothetical protein